MQSETTAAGCQTAVIYHEMYDGRGFSRLNKSWSRYRAGFDKFKELGLIAPDALENLETYSYSPSAPRSEFSSLIPHPSSFIPVYESIEATEEQLAMVHSLAHIRHVREMDAKGEGMFDRNDTPVWPGVYRRAALAYGGTLLAARLVGSGQARHVFHVAGGLHHAHYDRVSGFCIFNDIVGAVRLWQREYGYERIAILDVDGHHGDGTQSLLYNEPVLTVSLHQYDGRFFPGTGALGERGEGAGKGYCLNFPLPRYTTDAEYRPALEIALAQVEAYRPQAIILQFGTDGHFTDRMVGLKLSTYLYEEVAQQIHALAHRVCEGRLVVVSGGGYEPEAVARCWGLLLANLTGPTEALGHHYLTLHDRPSSLPSSVPAAVEQVDHLLQAIKVML